MIFVCGTSASVAAQSSCDGVRCSGHGECFEEGAEAYCLCEPGWAAEGHACRRAAIGHLVAARVLARKQGKGTFVTAPPMRHDLRRPHGLFGSLFSQSDDASAKLLLYELQVPPEEIAAAMKLRAGKQALIFRRLYLIDNKPVALLQVAKPLPDVWM